MEDSKKTFSTIFFLQNLNERVVSIDTETKLLQIHLSDTANEGKYLLSIAQHEWFRRNRFFKNDTTITLYEFLHTKTTLQQRFTHTSPTYIGGRLSRWMCLSMHVDDFGLFKELVAKAIVQFDSDKSYGLGRTLSTALGMRLF
eukprot:TRINITY_DN18015_c0_g1_i1.p1 TRINITY_DN18015_c0_g1~~TRINITY_DN18015_c0_g1_i1.p1  ORF type:complete len:143 (+),score=13.75 TRINITY_DN18015_c0_g1_i1:112-540(+)